MKNMFDFARMGADQMREFADTETRDQLMAYCMWNDRNGCWTDEECINEFGYVMPTENYRQIIRQWAQET